MSHQVHHSGEALDEFVFLTQGAIVQTFPLAGSNIVLSFPEPKLYQDNTGPYLGETIGRVANRIKNAEVQFANGTVCKLAANDDPHCLHGGHYGWGKKAFLGPRPVSRNNRQALEFIYVSNHGDEGFPGTLECRVWYFTKIGPSASELEIEYEVEYTGDECEETIVALTNHSYFNLNPGSSTIAGTLVDLSTEWHLEMDEQKIPTGDMAKFQNGPHFTLGEDGPVIDTCFVLNPKDEFMADTRGLPYRKLIHLSHPNTHINLEVLSTEPAFQLYTGDGIGVPATVSSTGKACGAMSSRSGIAVEPSRYVDAQRQDWRMQCTIKPGEKWGSRSLYRAWKAVQ